MTEYHKSVNENLDCLAMGSADESVYAPTDTKAARASAMIHIPATGQFGMDPAWLKGELSQPPRSQSGLARFMDLAPEQVNRMCTGKRSIKAHEADQIRAYLMATATKGATIAHIPQRKDEVEGLPVRGTVEAGSWREVSNSQLVEPDLAPLPKRYVSQGAEYALRVTGQSMNIVYPEGSYLFVAPFHGGPLPVGRRVIIERARLDGLVETTVKELLRGDDGDLVLMPRSTDPNHQAAIPYKDMPDVTVRIIGRVVGAFTPEE